MNVSVEVDIIAEEVLIGTVGTKVFVIVRVVRLRWAPWPQASMCEPANLPLRRSAIGPAEKELSLSSPRS